MIGVHVERFVGDAAEWDAFGRTQHGFTHFHLYGWRTVIERVFGHECIYLAAREDDGHLVGVLPLVRVRSAVFGHYLVSMPFVNYGGPLGAPGAIALLVEHAAELARAAQVKLLELRSRVPLPIVCDVSHRKITVLLDLPRDAAALFARFGAKLRAQVRRAAREEVSVRFGSDRLDAFFEVFSRHMRDLGTPTQPRALFAAISDVFGGDVWFGVATRRDEPIAAGCGVCWGGELEMTWASSLRAYNPIAPNMLLYWSFMERAVAQRLTTFNFGRCTPGGGTHRFKQQWGGRDEPLWWYHPASSRAEATPSPHDARYAWGQRVWRHLPTRIATALGPRIVRYIP